MQSDLVVGDHVVLTDAPHDDCGVVVRASDVDRTDWEGNKRPDWPCLLEVKWTKRTRWEAPELLQRAAPH
jgi:hypothetical protein